MLYGYEASASTGMRLLSRYCLEINVVHRKLNSQVATSYRDPVLYRADKTVH